MGEVGVGSQCLLRAFAEVGETVMQAEDQVLQKDTGVMVAPVQCIPADGMLQVMGEVHQQGGLAVAGRRGNQDQLAIHHIVQAIEQALSGQHVLPSSREQHFGGEHGVVHSKDSSYLG